MFSLIRFENGNYWVTKSSNLIWSQEKMIAAKFRGGRYAAKLILKNENKGFLLEYKETLDIKTKEEQQCKSITKASFKPLLPRSNSCFSKLSFSKTSIASRSQKTTDILINTLKPTLSKSISRNKDGTKQLLLRSNSSLENSSAIISSPSKTPIPVEAPASQPIPTTDILINTSKPTSLKSLSQNSLPENSDSNFWFSETRIISDALGSQSLSTDETLRNSSKTTSSKSLSRNKHGSRQFLHRSNSSSESSNSNPSFSETAPGSQSFPTTDILKNTSKPTSSKSLSQNKHDLKQLLPQSNFSSESSDTNPSSSKTDGAGSQSLSNDETIMDTSKTISSKSLSRNKHCSKQFLHRSNSSSGSSNFNPSFSQTGITVDAPDSQSFQTTDILLNTSKATSSKPLFRYKHSSNQLLSRNNSSSEISDTNPSSSKTRKAGDAPGSQSSPAMISKDNKGTSQPLLVLNNSTKDCSASNSFLNSTEKESYISNGTFSEYIPDTTIDNENIESTIETNWYEQEQSIMLIKDPLKISKVEVPHSGRSKKYFCIFCKTLQTKLSRHLFLKHKSEKQIQEASKLPKKCKERLQIIEELRKQGNFLHNTCTEYNTGILIVSRQQQRKYQNNVNDYVCCINCKGFFSKKTLRIHLKGCGERKKNSRHNLINGRKVTQFIHSAANYTLRTKIFPVLRDDEITRAVRYDELVIKFGNKLAEKYTLTHQHDMIRSHLRLLGRFLNELKRLDESIQELKDIYKPGLFDTCIEALRTVSSWDDSLMWFRTPAVAHHLTSLVKKCGSKQRSEFIKSGSEEAKKNLEDFLSLWEEEILVLINKKALEDQITQKRAKKLVLPTKKDIKKLYSYLKNKIFGEISTLENKFDLNCWNELVKATLIFIQIFNRRRAGEIERLTINSYLNKEVITNNLETEVFKNMSKESILFAKQYVRLTLRGKLGRTVSVLLSPLCQKAIDIILKNRYKAGIPKNNEYIFAKKATTIFSKEYYRACPLLRQFSLDCKADIPESLRGTSLRKHIATYISLLNVEDATVDQLANFMGHHKDIHKSVYRVSVPVAEITSVSKLLMSAIGDNDEEGHDEEEGLDDEENTDDGDLEIEGTILDTSKNTSSSATKKKRSTSPYGKTKRVKWSEEERAIVLSAFGNLKDIKKLPSNMECLNIIKNNHCLRNRTPAQMKSWIDNQRRSK